MVACAHNNSRRAFLAEQLRHVVTYGRPHVRSQLSTGERLAHNSQRAADYGVQLRVQRGLVYGDNLAAESRLKL